MKQRHLRPNIQKALTIIAIACLPVLMIDDFDLRALPIIVILATLEFTSAYLLIKYGRGTN